MITLAHLGAAHSREYSVVPWRIQPARSIQILMRRIPGRVRSAKNCWINTTDQASSPIRNNKISQ